MHLEKTTEIKTKLFIDFESIFWPVENGRFNGREHGPYAMSIAVDIDNKKHLETFLYDASITAVDCNQIKESIEYFLKKHSIEINDIVFVAWGGDLELAILSKIYGEDFVKQKMFYLDKNLGVNKAHQHNTFSQSHLEKSLKINIDNGIKEFIRHCFRFDEFEKIYSKLKMDKDGRVAYVLGLIYTSFVNGYRLNQNTFEGKFVGKLQRLVTPEFVESTILKYNSADVEGMIEICRRLPFTELEKESILKDELIIIEKIKRKSELNAYVEFVRHFEIISKELDKVLPSNNETLDVKNKLLASFNEKIEELKNSIKGDENYFE